MVQKTLAKVGLFSVLAAGVLALALTLVKPVAAADERADCYVYRGGYWDGPYTATVAECASWLWQASQVDRKGLGYGVWGENQVVVNTAGHVYYRNAQLTEWTALGTLAQSQAGQGAASGAAQSNKEQQLWQQCDAGNTSACQQLTALYNRQSARYDAAMKAWDSYYNEDWVKSFGLMGDN